MAEASIARVLIDSPLPQLDRLFDYGIPEHLVDSALPGVRVRVPLRSAARLADGIIIEIGPRGEHPGPLSQLESVVSPLSVLTADVWALARKASDRAAGSAMDIVRLAVPRRQVRVETAFLSAAHAADTGPASALSSAVIESYETGVLESAITQNERLAVDAVPGVRELPGRTQHAPGATVESAWVGSWAITMAAAAAITLAGGRNAILAVPDYRDQWQLQAALDCVLPASRIVRLDAKQSNPDRYRNFLRCLGDEPRAIIGNRSVIYAPSRNLGLIALWDDGDPLYSEPLRPYVHTRDAALMRQEQQSCAVLFFGHTRSTEVQRLVDMAWVRSLSPTPLQRPKVIPTAQQTSDERWALEARIPSSAWKIVRTALEAGPVLVQVARPGYAPRLACADCQHTVHCLRCEGPVSQKSAQSTPACHWCGALATSMRCRYCDGEKLRFIGTGATRTAEELGRAFPGVRVIIADGERQVHSVGTDAALVIATRGAEPIAAGGYRAVLLLDGERMLARESLRVGEDCLRWWSNAAALAAAGAPTVLVGVGGAVASALVTWRQADYARTELADRRKLRFPPAIRVATVTGTPEAVAAAVAHSGIAAADVLGPVESDPPLVRAILRFDYSRGGEVAAALRAELVRSATSRRPRLGGGTASMPTTRKLRIRFDDAEPFGET
ncbi:MAG: primosomal protein N' [Rhodoglobus sp.]